MGLFKQIATEKALDRGLEIYSREGDMEIKIEAGKKYDMQVIYLEGRFAIKFESYE